MVLNGFVSFMFVEFVVFGVVFVVLMVVVYVFIFFDIVVVFDG